MLSILHFSFFFFKQKTAYEMRISDWSADVCSSDLRFVALHLGQLDQFGGVVALFLDRARRGHRLVEPATLAHHLPRRPGIVPQRRVLDLRKIGRASWRGRVCQYVSLAVVAVSLKKKKRKIRSDNSRIFYPHKPHLT